MKKLFFATLICLLTLSAAGQTSEQLIGKWQLVKWTKKEKEKDIVDFYKTDQVFQVFKEDGKFESVIGDKTHKGTWKLSSDNKKLTIFASIATVEFTIDYFDDQKRIITEKMMGTLEYKKVSE